MQLGVVIVPSAFNQKAHREVQAQDKAIFVLQGLSQLCWSLTDPLRASTPNTNSQHKNAQHFPSKTR